MEAIVFDRGVVIVISEGDSGRWSRLKNGRGEEKDEWRKEAIKYSR